MRRGVLAAVLGSLVLAPSAAAMWSPIQAPVRFEEVSPWRGWTLVTVTQASGDVVFGALQGPVDTEVHRLVVRDAAQRTTLSFETTSAAVGGTDARVGPVSRTIREPFAQGAMAFSIQTAPDCPLRTVGSLSGGIHETAVQVNAACLGPLPWEVLSYGVGSVESRGLRLRSNASLEAQVDARGNGGILIALRDAVGSAHAELEGSNVRAAHGAMTYAPRGRFAGSFATLERSSVGISYATNGTSLRTCPCAWEDLGRGTWAFGHEGPAPYPRELYLAGVELPPR